MYPMRFPTCYLLVVLFYFGAAEPPPTHGYGPPSPVEFNSNEVASHEYKSPATDFGNYASFSSGSSSGYAAPNTNYAKPTSNFAPHFGGARSGAFPTYKSGGGGKNGVSSSYISIVHGPGGAASPSKQRPVAYAGPAKGQSSASLYKSSNFAPASFGEGSSSGFSSDEISTYFGKGFGAAPSSQYKESSGYDFAPPRNPGRKQQQQGADYEGGASDEVGSYSSGGPSYATFSGSKPVYNPSTFSGSSHGGSRGNAYSTSNVHFGSGGKVSSGHGNFHPPSFVGSFKPSSTKAYNRYSSPTGGNYQQQASGSGSSSSYGVAPLVGSETAFNSRALKSGYTSDHASKNGNEFSGEDAGSNYFAGFGDGAGFKVQSSYSTG